MDDPLNQLKQLPDGYINTPIGKDIHNWTPPSGAHKVHLPAEDNYPTIRSTNLHPNEANEYFYYDYSKIANIKNMYASQQQYDLPAGRFGPSNSIPITESEVVLAQRVQVLLLVALGAIGISMII